MFITGSKSLRPTKHGIISSPMYHLERISENTLVALMSEIEYFIVNVSP